MNIGVVGCGNISDIYLENLTGVFPKWRKGSLERVVAVADLDDQKAQRQAKRYAIPRVSSLDEMLQDPEIHVILNLTNPGAHFGINSSALLAGKHVYSEKPLCLSNQEAQQLLSIADEKKRWMGCAPDTILGGGIQTCREVLDKGAIGKVVGVAGFMTCPGHEWWHPDPEFYYQPGGGPLLDMGPYYLSTMVYLLGSIREVQGMAATPQAFRTIFSGPKAGKKFEVQTPTHITALLGFENGALGNLVMSFDTWYSHLPFLEIYGEKGTLTVPDPNSFGGPVLLRKSHGKEWEQLNIAKPFTANSRGLGLIEMIDAIQENHECICSGKTAAHVLEAMNGILEAAQTGNSIPIQSPIPNSRLLPNPLSGQ